MYCNILNQLHGIHGIIQYQLFFNYTECYLFQKLSQDVIKLSHQMAVDGLSGAYVFKFQEHVKGSRRRAQCLKSLINYVDGFCLNNLKKTHVKSRINMKSIRNRIVQFHWFTDKTVMT